MFSTVFGRFSRLGVKSPRNLVLLRRLAVEPLEQRAMLSVVPGSIAGPAQQQTLAGVPVAVQQAISSAIGQDQSAYHAVSADDGATLANPANGFTAQVQAGALLVSAGSDTWDMTLTGLGYGGAVLAAGTAQTSVNGNRVDLNYGAVNEWYVNGPAGLEQGFNVPSPQGSANGPLTVELALGGDLTATVNAAGDGLALTRPDGTSALGYTGLTARDAAGKSLPATMEVRADGDHQELLIHVGTAGAQGQITIDPFVQEAKLTASDGAASDNFGYSVSTSGSTMVVGAYWAAVGGNGGQGAAYVFTESASGWTQTAKLTASDGGGWFGFSVAISGDTIVVGSPEATASGESTGLIGQGAAYVFTESASGWTQAAKLTASDGAAFDYFGYSVSISDNTVVVAAWAASVGGNIAQGAAYVFTEPASGWANMTQTAKITASDGAANDHFGWSISISGSTVVVGVAWATVGANANQGAAYVFTEPASGWVNMTQTAKLTASDGAALNGFGASVSISGSTVVVGAPYATVGGDGGQGAAYVFTEPNSGWANTTETIKLTAPDGAADNEFGYSVSISPSGDTIVVGSPYAAVGGNQGAAYVFAETGSGWVKATETAKLTASDGAEGDFGNSVSVSGSTVVVGAPERHGRRQHLPGGGLRVWDINRHCPGGD